MSNDNLVPEPQPSVFDAVNGVLQDEEAARRVMANPALAKGFPNGRPIEHSAASGDDTCACGGHHGKCGCQDDEQSDGSEIPIKAIDDIGRATAEDVREALHQVIDPELGIDVIDLGLVYGIEIDELGRAIITMTLTTPACPLTDLIEDECASTLAGLGRGVPHRLDVGSALDHGAHHARRPRPARRPRLQLRQYAKVLIALQ